MKRMSLLSVVLLFLCPIVFADQADQVFVALAAKNDKEASSLLQNLAISRDFNRLDKVQSKNPELFSAAYFPDTFLTGVLFNYVDKVAPIVRKALAATGKANPNDEGSWQWYIWDLDKAAALRGGTNDATAKKTLKARIDKDEAKLIESLSSLEVEGQLAVALYLYSYDATSLTDAFITGGRDPETTIADRLNAHFSAASMSILEYLFKAGVPFPARLPSSLKLEPWNRERLAFSNFIAITNVDKQNQFETKDEFAARRAEALRVRDLITSTEIVWPLTISLGQYNVDGGYFDIAAKINDSGLSQDAMTTIRNQNLTIDIRDDDKADVRYCLDRKKAPFFRDKGFAAWTATAVLAARKPGIYRLKELQFKDGMTPVTEGVWAFSIRPTLGKNNENIVLVDNYTRGREYDFSGTKVTGYETSIPISAPGNYTLTSAAGGPGLLWQAKLAAGDFQITRFAWTPLNAAGNREWTSIASSADGTHLAACENRGDIWTSSDSGATWLDRKEAGTKNWISVISSADGSHLAAIEIEHDSNYGDSGDVWTSTDYGSNWTDQKAVANKWWLAMASNADGSQLFAAAFDRWGNRIGDLLWISRDAGATWSNKGAAWDRGCMSIASSADGTHLSLVGGDTYDRGYIWISNDSGSTWTKHMEPLRKWTSIALSADGTRLAACENGGDIWTSADDGNTWMDQKAAGKRGWESITSSTDGSRLVATETDGETRAIWASADFGVTWTAQDLIWTSQGVIYTGGQISVASSADGTHLVATLPYGDIWTAILDPY